MNTDDLIEQCDCGACDGTGTVKNLVRSVPDTWWEPGWDEYEEIDCPVCGGTGRWTKRISEVEPKEEIAF